MGELILFILAFLITLPIFSTIVVYYILKYIYGNPIRAFHKAINWTTVLYILAVNTMLTYLFESFFIGDIFVVMLLILTFLIVNQWKRNTEIDYGRAFKLLWRLSFLLFFILYIILVVYGIIDHMLK
ncbi:DUF3397 domain-containing protein [Ornithinibacillus xuwenensis]|uniref:DUF3397 domain-containing protein n=1 Tax=Ornithinibacillus xuwenensis TaxID=3144668 RepID=A0ABU9XHD2_9BACI